VRPKSKNGGRIWSSIPRCTRAAAGNPGAVINKVIAVTRRLIEGLLSDGTIVPSVATAFESKAGIASARTKLRTGNNPHRALGHNTIRAYLGQGEPNHAQAEAKKRQAHGKTAPGKRSAPIGGKRSKHLAADDAAKAFNWAVAVGTTNSAAPETGSLRVF
jgi:hypothetical protein